MTDGLYARLERAAREGIGEGAFLRLSRDESALFATDFPKRCGALKAEERIKALENAGWKAVLENGLCFLTPSATLCESLCPAMVPDDVPWRRETAFASLIRRYETCAQTDGRFLLYLLRAVGRARLRDGSALWDAKAAYARALAEKSSARTPLTAALSQELCDTIAEGDGI